MSPSHARPRPTRPRWGLGVLAALLVVALVAGGAWIVRSRNDAPPPPPPSGSPTPSPSAPAQQTLLLQVSDDDGVAVNNALLSTYEAGGSSSSIGVQPGLILTAPGVEQSTVARSLSLPGNAGAGPAVSALLGVRVDGTWTLGRLAFAGLVDAVGGVEVDVPEAITVRNPNGTLRFSLPKGISTLDGPQATLYVQTLLPGEAEADRMARFQEVFRQVEVKLPPDRLRVEALLGSLGALSRSTMPSEALAAFLLQLRADINLARLTTVDLPVQPADLPGVEAVRIDPVKGEALVTKLLDDARLEVGPDSPARVLVQLGIARPAAPLAARTELAAAGLAPLAGGDADRMGYTESLILVPAGVDGAALQGQLVAKALRLPASAVRASAVRTVADVVVVLGADYAPQASPAPEPSVS